MQPMNVNDRDNLLDIRDDAKGIGNCKQWTVAKYVLLGMLVVGLIIGVICRKTSSNQNDLSMTGSVDEDIVGGVETRANNFRSVVSVQFRRQRRGRFRHDCGGTLLSGRSVLTAAHCCDGRQIFQLQVVLGEHNLNRNSGREVVRPVSAITNHPDYLARNNNPDRADVCVLTLQTAVRINNQIQFVTLANQGRAPPRVGHTATVVGWGATRSGGAGSNVLRRVAVGILSDATCRRQYLNNFIERSMICASRPGADSCQGDSGGPMFATARNTLVQVGIVSWGRGCAAPRQPGVYAEVSHYTNWIRRQIVN